MSYENALKHSRNVKIQNLFEAKREFEYAFDFKLQAALRLRANSLAEAEALVRRFLDAASCNGGCWPNGDPILFEASVDGDLSLFHEINGTPPSPLGLPFTQGEDRSPTIAMRRMGLKNENAF